MMEPGAVQGPVLATDLKTSIAGLRSGTVTEIRLEGSVFDENIIIKQMQEFAEALGKNKSLTMLYFDCWIGGDEGAKILATGLEKNESLKVLAIRDTELLRLNSSRIRNAGASAIAKALKNNTSLTVLSLNYNAIGTFGINEILLALTDHGEIRVLDFGNNSFDGSAADSFANFLKDNYRVEKLILDGNRSINKIFIEKIFSILVKRNKTLKSLSLKKIEFSKEALESMAILVQLNDTLTEVFFDTFRSQDLERKKIIEKLQENSKHKPTRTERVKALFRGQGERTSNVLSAAAAMQSTKLRENPQKVIESLLLEAKFDEALECIEKSSEFLKEHGVFSYNLPLMKSHILIFKGEYQAAAQCFHEIKLEKLIWSSTASRWIQLQNAIIDRYDSLLNEITGLISAVELEVGKRKKIELINFYSLAIKLLLKIEAYPKAKGALEKLLSINVSIPLTQLLLKEFLSVISQKLSEAVKTNDLEEVKKLSALMLPNQLYPSALHFAIEQRNSNMLQSVLDLNLSDVNAQNNTGQTPLHYAVVENLEKAVYALHKKGADLNVADLRGNTSLHLAILINSPILILLLKLGADPNKQTTDGNTALHLAMRKRLSASVIKELIDKGASRIIKNEVGKTPLHYMGENGQIEVLKLLLQKLIINLEDFTGNTPLHSVIQDGGSLEMVEIFLKNGADINQKNLEGNTSLHIALSQQRSELIGPLLNYGAKLYILNENSETPLHLAAKVTDVSVINSLIVQASKENSLHSFWEIKNKDGFTALQIGVISGNLPFVRALINSVRKDVKEGVGSLINFKSSKASGEQTPLHLAVMCGDFASVKFLVENGADYWLINGDNKTPLALAVQLAKEGKGNVEIKHYLKRQQTQAMSSLIIKVFAQQCVPQPPAEILIKNLTLILQQHYLKTWIKQQQGKEFAITLGKHIATAVNTAMKFIKDSNSLAAMVQNNDHEQIQQMLRLIIDEAYQNTQKPVQKSPSFIDSMQFSEIVVTQKGLYISRSKLYELKKKAFSRAIKEGIRYLFYVNLALVKGEVKRPDNGFDSARTLFTTLSPSISAAVCEVSQNEKSSFKVGLAFSLVNILFQAIGAYEDRKARMRANCVVEAFQDEGNPDSINIDAIKAIAEILFERFRYQIMQLSVSIGTNGKLRSHGADGVFKFAQVIVQRIGSHILNDGSKEIDASNIQFVRAISGLGNSIGKAFIKLFGQAQNIKAKQLTPLIQRCLMATWLEDVGVDVPIPLDKSQAGKALTWQAGDILCFTGIRDEKQPENCYFRQGYFKEELGYCFASGEEIEFRKYKPYKQIPLDKIEGDEVKNDKEELQSSSSFRK